VKIDTIHVLAGSLWLSTGFRTDRTEMRRLPLVLLTWSEVVVGSLVSPDWVASLATRPSHHEEVNLCEGNLLCLRSWPFPRAPRGRVVVEVDVSCRGHDVEIVVMVVMLKAPKLVLTNISFRVPTFRN
jgi:hypothetical protein